MAWVRFRSGSFQVNFRFQGKERNFTLGPVSQAEADAKAAHVDYLLMRLKQGLVELPAGVDIVSFVEQDGKAAPAAKASSRRASETVGTLRDRYLATHAGAQEEKTLYTTRIHFKHVVATLGEGFPLSDLTHASLQQHINRRASGGLRHGDHQEGNRHAPGSLELGPEERAGRGRVAGRGLVYRKTSEKPPFQTRDEIERQINIGRTDRRPEEGALGRALPPAGRGRRAAGDRPRRSGPSVDLPDGLHRSPHRSAALGADPDARRRRGFRLRRWSRSARRSGSAGSSRRGACRSRRRSPACSPNI